MVLKVFQDSGDFYEDKEGGFIWSAPFCVKDFDIAAAEDARRQFLEYCGDHNIEVEFV